jgi:hypothetical protein
MAYQASVSVERDAPADEVVAVERVLRSFGIQAAVETNYGRKSFGELPFVVYIVMPIVVGFLGALGADLYKGAKRFVQEITEARRGLDGEIFVKDEQSGTMLVLVSGLPEEAYRAFADVDWSELTGGSIVWDAEHGEWRNAFPRR